MGELRVVAERLLPVPASVVYECVADYRTHHHRFLPPQFSGYRVEAGGVGAGTVLSFTVRAGGPPRAFRTVVEEPERGRVIVERDTLSPLVTTTTVEATPGGCRVRFETVWPSAAGFTGLVERLFAPAVMRRMYEDELSRLERYAAALPGAA